MILVFSGTGNSYHVAKSVGDSIGEVVCPLVDCSPEDLTYTGKSLGLVFPIYSWGVPPIVINYLKNLNDSFVNDALRKPIWVIMVCGDETGKAPDMLRKSLAERGLKLTAGWSVQAPNNYVILPGFDVDSKQVEEEKLSKIKNLCDIISHKLNNREFEFNFVEGPLARLKTKLVYPLFKRWGIFPSRWGYTDACVSCGKCASACPVGNITMSLNVKESKSFPQWGDNCESCLACYHICPRHAVKYGNATRKKGQYYFGPNR